MSGMPSSGISRPMTTGNLMADCERWCRDNLRRREVPAASGTTLRLVAASPDSTGTYLTRAFRTTPSAGRRSHRGGRCGSSRTLARRRVPPRSSGPDPAGRVSRLRARGPEEGLAHGQRHGAGELLPVSGCSCGRGSTSRSWSADSPGAARDRVRRAPVGGGEGLDVRRHGVPGQGAGERKGRASTRPGASATRPSAGARSVTGKLSTGIGGRAARWWGNDDEARARRPSRQASPVRVTVLLSGPEAAASCRRRPLILGPARTYGRLPHDGDREVRGDAATRRAARAEPHRPHAPPAAAPT